MKKSLFTLAFLCLLAFASFAQTIRRCNNNAGVTGVNVYTTIQAAHDAAVAGDVIYVEPSLTDYGSLIATKRLTIIGNGYNLSENTNTTFNKMESKITSFSFGSGSENSVLMGILSTTTFANSISATSVTITRCKMLKLYIGAANATITKNDISQISQSTFATVNSHLITNNIVSQIGLSNSGTTPILNSTISNNCIGHILYANGSTITNNIFSFYGSGTDPSNPITGTTNSITNNISTYYTLPTTNGNFNSTVATIFAVNPHTTLPSFLDTHYQLAVSSPAIGAGTGGTDCGIFGGSSPYVLSGQPSTPVITNLNVATAGNAANPLQVSVTVRGNN